MSGMTILPAGLGLEAIFCAVAKGVNQLFLQSVIGNPGAQQIFYVQNTIVVETCLESALCSDAYTVARSAKGAAKGGDDAQRSFIAWNLVMKCCRVLGVA